ncbi:MAG: alpha/beta fold hydrolase [Weeksellaceae bacterium]
MFIKIQNRKIHYKKFGSGQPILFVHGWGGSIHSLHALADLASRRYTCILLDLPGFGKSDNPPPQWGVEGYAEVIKAFLKELGIKRTHYVGHSFGGNVGIYLSTHESQLINKLVLCNTSYKREKKVSSLAKATKGIDRKELPIIKQLYPIVKYVYYRIMHRDSDLMKYPHLENNFRKIVTQDLTPQLPKIKQQTLILWGEEDTQTPVIWAYELYKLIPHAEIKVFPQIRHNLPIKYPQEVWTEIEPFLRA